MSSNVKGMQPAPWLQSVAAFVIQQRIGPTHYAPGNHTSPKCIRTLVALVDASLTLVLST